MSYSAPSRATTVHIPSGRHNGRPLDAAREAILAVGWKRTALTGTVAAMRCNELFRQILEIDPEVLTPSLSREAEPAILIRGYLRP